MNQDQITSIVRWVLGVAGSYVLASGKIDGNTWAQITTAAVTIVPMVWGFFVHTDSAKLAAVEALPGVEKIVVGPEATDGVAKAVIDTTRPKVVADSPAPITSNLQRKY